MLSDISILGFKNNKFNRANFIPKDEVCVVCLGGENSTEIDGSETVIPLRYMLVTSRKVKDHIAEDIPIYSIAYNYRKLDDPSISRIILFSKRDNKRFFTNYNEYIEALKSMSTKEDITPAYIDDLYEKVIKQRISRNNGTEKLPTEEACKNIRKINFVAHCHGGYVITMLENKMQQEMSKLGYSIQEKNKIQSQMLITGFSVACPLGTSKSKFISLMSIKDTCAPTSNNIFKNYIYSDKNHDEIKDFTIGFFPKKQGNFFLVDKKHIEDDDFLTKEHKMSFGYSEQTPQGAKATKLIGNIFINGILHSLKTQTQQEYQDLPSTHELIQNPNNPKDQEPTQIMNNALDIGAIIYKKIHQYAKTISKV